MRKKKSENQEINEIRVNPIVEIEDKKKKNVVNKKTKAKKNQSDNPIINDEKVLTVEIKDKKNIANNKSKNNKKKSENQEIKEEKVVSVEIQENNVTQEVKSENSENSIPNQKTKKFWNNRFNKFKNKKNKPSSESELDKNVTNPPIVEEIIQKDEIIEKKINIKLKSTENISISENEKSLPKIENEPEVLTTKKNNKNKNVKKTQKNKEIPKLIENLDNKIVENIPKSKVIEKVINTLEVKVQKNALKQPSNLQKTNKINELKENKNTPKPKIPIITAKELNENREIKDYFNNFMQILENDLSVLHGSKILIGVSGGIDSIVLLDMFFNIAKKYSFKLYVIHFNHLLRGNDSDEDQLFVEKLCEKYLIPFLSASGNVKEYALKNGFSIETAARELRYEFFQRKAQSLSANYIATAHHSNDNSETFLLNLFRGSGLTGLTGIPNKREIMKNTYLIRPFLKMSKIDILNYAKFRKLKWREDLSNQFSNFKRNKVRLNLIKDIEKDYCTNFTEIITRTTEILKNADNFIQEHLEYLLKFIQREKKGSRLRIKLNGLVNNATFIQGELLQKILTETYKIQNLPNNAIQRIISLFEAQVGTQIDVTNNIVAVRDRFEIAFARNKELISIDKSITKIGTFKINDLTIKLDEVQKNQVKFNLGNHIEFFDYDLVNEVLQIRNWQSGDYFHPIGMQSIVKISDFLTNKKIPVLDKKNILVLMSENEIIWVIKQRISENFKITDNTKRYLRIEVIS